MKFGLCSFCYRWSIGRPYYRPMSPMTIDTFLEKNAQYGMHYAMLCNNTEWNTLTQTRLQEIRDKSDALGISLDLGIREVSPEKYYRAFQDAQILGASVMRFVYDLERKRDPAEDKQEVDKLRHLLDQVLPAAEKAGITMAMENGPFLLHNEIKELIQEYNSPNLGACLDSMNCAYAIYRAEEVFQTLAPYAKMVHLKDFVVEPKKRGYIFRGVALGDGILDIKRLTDYLTEANYSGKAYLELYIDRKENEPDTFEYEETSVRRSVEYAKEIGLL